jgi:hypothetical protein
MSQDLVRSVAAPLALTMPEEERQEVMAAFHTNCASGSITEFDLPRIKVASGTALWLLNELEGEATVPAIEGVVVHVRDTRSYFHSKDAGNAPPDCSSRDGLIGIGKPGGRCVPQVDENGKIVAPGCPLAEFDSAPDGGAGQACKQAKQLFILRGTSMLPEVVSIPPTSLKAIRQFLLKLVTQRMQYHHCILRIELEKAQNAQGKVYGKAVMKFVRRLSPEEIARAEEMRAFAQSFAARVTAGTATE